VRLELFEICFAGTEEELCPAFCITCTRNERVARPFPNRSIRTFLKLRSRCCSPLWCSRLPLRWNCSVASKRLLVLMKSSCSLLRPAGLTGVDGTSDKRRRGS